jgi:acetyl esterase/lipase
MRSLVLCLLAGFALPATATAATGPTIREETAIGFGKGGDTNLKLDLAMPAEGAGPFPAVVCIHGGGWVGGKRQEMNQTIRTLAGRGFVAVTPDYRLATAQARFPAQVEDCKAAVRWLRANAATYKIDPNHIGAVGFAAGGHLACMLGVTDKNDGLDGSGGNADWSSQVQAVVSFFGPTDLTANDWGLDVSARNLVPLLGGTAAEKPEAYRKASPLNYAGKNAAPLLLFHGAADKMVPLDQSRRLAEKVASAGGSAQLVVVEGEGHGFRPEKLVQCLGKMVTFFDERLKP